MFTTDLFARAAKSFLTLLLPVLLLFPSALTAADAGAFAREDWTYSVEPTHMDYWGINRWGVNSFMLPYRIVQRAKRGWEHRRFDNWRFGSETGGARGVLMRTASSAVDMVLFLGPQNLDHVLGHDNRARELYRDYPGSYRYVTKRFSQTLPVYLGGSELDSQNDKPTNGKGGADQNTLTNSTIWEAHNQFTYFIGKKIMTEERVNAAQMENLILHRLNKIQMTWLGADQACAPYHGTLTGSVPLRCRDKEGSDVDYSNFLMDLNTGRYGVANVRDYELKLGDLQRANELQLIDPVFLAAVYRYGTDYIGHGKNLTYLPMLRVPGTGLHYLPGLRVYLSPFGIEYYQDNYFRYKRTLVNLFWTRGDNKYQKRAGYGLDVDNIPLWRKVTGGAYWEVSRQPHVNRIIDTSPLTTAELDDSHNVYNYGTSLRVPVWTFGAKEDPEALLFTVKAGRKNTGWIPGEYIRGSFYLETGVGLRI